MEGLRVKKYLHTTRKRFDPLALILSTAGVLAVVATVGGLNDFSRLWDLRSVLIVVGGTCATLLFQFDLTGSAHATWITLRSFLGTPDRVVMGVVRQLDDAILAQRSLSELRDGFDLNGELLNDIVYMHRQGLLFEEIDAFVSSRISDEYLGRQIAVNLLQRAATIAPALGLFGTVMGLIGVLRSLASPADIGPSMSLALLTTAYGTGLGSLVFSPLAGRLEHHNHIYLEVHKQLLNKVGILLNREERNMNSRFTAEAYLDDNETAGAAG